MSQTSTRNRFRSAALAAGTGIPIALSGCGSGADARSDAESRAETARHQSVEARVNAILAEQLGLDVKKLKPGQRFIADLGADSLDVVELVMAFEEEFRVEINDADAVGYLKKRAPQEYSREPSTPAYAAPLPAVREDTATPGPILRPGFPWQFTINRGDGIGRAS